MDYKIGELAEEFDVTPRAIRFYEEQHLIHPSRKGSSRLYGPRDRARLKLILRGKRLGFSLGEIREMLDLYEIEDGEIGQLRHCLEVGGEKIATLEDRKQNIEATLAELRGFQERFVKLLREKEQGTVGVRSYAGTSPQGELQGGRDAGDA